MPSLTDWLLVGITALYLLFTFGIWIANIITAKSSKAQLDELKRQYEDTKRLNILPYIVVDSHGGEWKDEIELCIADSGKMNYSCVSYLSIKNIGNGTAKDFRYIWNNEDGAYDRGAFPVIGLKSGDSHSIMLAFINTREDLKIAKCSIELFYKDMLENCYKQTIVFEFQINVSQLKMAKMYTNSPVLIKE